MKLMRNAAVVTSLLALALSGCSTSTNNSGDGANTPGGDTPVPTQPADNGGASTEPGDTGGSTGTDAAGDIPKGDGSQTIYLVSKGFQHRFWQAVKEGAEKAGQEYGYKIEFVGPDDETKVTQQIDQLKTAVDSKPAAIGFAALDTKAAQPVLDQIEGSGIPVVAFDSGVDSDLPVTTVQTDNAAAAAEAAKRMSELVGGKGTVGMVCHDQTSQTGKARCEGFRDWMKQNAPGIKLLEPQYGYEVGVAAGITKSMIQTNPDIVGVYGSNEASATGVVQGTIESGKTDLKVVGFDSGKTQIDAVKNGQMAGAITQSPVLMGEETVKAAIRAINNIEQPKVIDSGFAWYDKTNLDDPEIAPNLYE